MSRLLIHANPVVPRGQFFAQDGRGEGAAPSASADAEGTPKIHMGFGDATTGADGPAQLQPGGKWIGDTWCNVLTTAGDGSRAIRPDVRIPPPEPSRNDPRLFHYAGRQWNIRREIFNGNLLLLLDREVINDPGSFADSSIDIAGHWMGLYRVNETSYAALTQQDASFLVRAFNQEVTNNTAALDASTAETTDDLAKLAYTRLHTILSAGDKGKITVDDRRSYTNIWINDHRVSVDYRSRHLGDNIANQAIATALGLLPMPFLKLIDTIFFHAETQGGPIADRPGGVSATAPEDLYEKRYVDLRAVHDATPSAIVSNLLNLSARAFLTHSIALVPEVSGWQIVPDKPLDKERWQRPSDFVSDLDAVWILAHRADQRHPQLIRHYNRVTWPLADGVAQDLTMIIGDDGNVNSTWVDHNPHLALLYSAWLSKIHTRGLLLPGEITGPLERAVWLFLKQMHHKG